MKKIVIVALLVLILISPGTALAHNLGDTLSSAEVANPKPRETEKILELKKDPTKSLGKQIPGLPYYSRFPLDFKAPCYIGSIGMDKLDEWFVRGDQSLFGDRDYFTIVLKESKDSKRKGVVLTINKKDKGIILRKDGSFQATVKKNYDHVGFYMILPENNIESLGYFEIAPIVSE